MKSEIIKGIIFVGGTVGVALLLISVLKVINVPTYSYPSTHVTSNDSPLATDIGVVTDQINPTSQFAQVVPTFPEAGALSVESDPVHIVIPSIHVDAALEQVGLTPQGDVDVPVGPVNPAWFQLGPRPGAIGSAIIVGHYGWKNSIPAVFDNLSQLEKGDKLYVKNENGELITFVVRSLRTYGANDAAEEVFISGDQEAHLNLITCSGTWNKSLKSYSSRLVVFADKEKT